VIHTFCNEIKIESPSAILVIIASTRVFRVAVFRHHWVKKKKVFMQSHRAGPLDIPRELWMQIAQETSLFGVVMSCKKLHESLVCLIYQTPELKSKTQYLKFANSVEKYGMFVENLDLSQIRHRWEFLDSTYLQLIAPYCLNVTALDLDDCLVQDGDIAHLARFHLHHLSLASCKRITNRGLNNLALITSLRSVDVSRLPLVSEAGFGFLSSLQLVHLNVAGTAITNRILPLLSNLKSVDISCCYLLDNASLYFDEKTEVITDSLEPKDVNWIGT
jgi:hypothetical protein